MKLLLKNKIQIDGHVEYIKELLECQKYLRNGKTYLEFENAEGQKNLIKFDDKEMQRIQYSEPKTKMTFIKGLSSSLFFEGLGWIEITTMDYRLEEKSLTVVYEMKKEGQLLGNYELQLEYGE